MCVYLGVIKRKIYIYQEPGWPQFTWDNQALMSPLSKARSLQGRLVGTMESLGFILREEAMLEALAADVINTSKIEGEDLDRQQVRSSIARKLGMEITGSVKSDRHVDGVVEMMIDATHHYKKPLTKTRLCNWHAALFPTGRSGMFKITVGDWRKDGAGPMQVVSGALGKEKVHFQAPTAKKISKEMIQFLDWFKKEKELEPVIKSAIAHLWFITIHPFDDGNGRIARAIADLQLAQADNSTWRYYSMSTEIERQKKGYYHMLETTQKGSLNITKWLLWYLECLHKALQTTEEILGQVLSKAKFWETHRHTTMNDRQKKMVNTLLNGFEGKLTTTKWARITKSSQDTALRDIQDLMVKKVVIKEEGGGRSTSYVLKFM